MIRSHRSQRDSTRIRSGIFIGVVLSAYGALITSLLPIEIGVTHNGIRLIRTFRRRLPEAIQRMSTNALLVFSACIASRF